jgi:hypothetical protein
LSLIRRQFGAAICADGASFWDEKKSASVATLMLVSDVAKIEDVEVRKRDRRGWVVFKRSNDLLL